MIRLDVPSSRGEGLPSLPLYRRKQPQLFQLSDWGGNEQGAGRDAAVRGIAMGSEMPGIGPVMGAAAERVAHATVALPVRALAVAAVAVPVLAGLAWAGHRALTAVRSADDADAARGARQVGAPLPARTEPLGATLDPRYLQLTKTSAAAATSAADPASFAALLGVDGPGWAAADGTISVPLGDGRVLWLFGDTLLHVPDADGNLVRNAAFVRNSAVLQDGATATTLASESGGRVGSFLQPEQAGEWYWPGHGIVQGNELVLFMSRVRKTADGAPGWNFQRTGSDMVRLDLQTLAATERRSMPGGDDGTDWGSAVVEDGAHTYVYGFRGSDDGQQRAAVVARAPRGELGDAPFEYWNGDAWTDDPSTADDIAAGVSNSYSVTRTPAGRWAMISQELMFGTGLQVRTADSPEGPWSEWRRVDDGLSLPEGTISYNAQVHPSFTQDGALLASWNVNRTDGRLPGPSELDTYRPIFGSINASVLDAGALVGAGKRQ